MIKSFVLGDGDGGTDGSLKCSYTFTRSQLFKKRLDDANSNIVPKS